MKPLPLSEKSNEELTQLFNERMIHNYLLIEPDYHFDYPNSYEGDCLKIAHALTSRYKPNSEKTIEEIMVEINSLAVELKQRNGTRQSVFDSASRISIISEKYIK